MHIITRKRIHEFSSKHPDANNPLTHWYKEVKRRRFANFAQVRQVFPSADLVGSLIVFNIGGNKYRLICAIHFNRDLVYIRAILTHQEYERSKWKE
ncbi:MAG: mRNA interferase toxin HigB [Anaerolineae bacterium]|nr:mRNA interferase toxin HigB [Anaerolineae bacterium]